jgi:ceramide glucosyltransferase
MFYVVFAMWRLLRFARRVHVVDAPTPSVTVLKPVCGLDQDLYENLRSFCEQDYPAYQVIFGVSDPEDPALAVIDKLIQALPEKDLSLVVNDRLIGTNRKVSNLANMYGSVKHEIVVIADSDMHVGPDYLRSVIASFRDTRVGAVTCLYTGIPGDGLASVLGAAFINEWFLPSVLVALSFQKINFCFGSTMAVRRAILEQLGGFARFANLLADDYMLGKLVSDAGYRVSLSQYVVSNVIYEPDFRTLFLHELRWAATIRGVQPLGYSLSFITYCIPMSLLYFAVCPDMIDGMITVAGAVLLRILMHFTARYSLGIKGRTHPLWSPLRDLLCFTIWAVGLFNRSVHWRQYTYALKSEGQLEITEQQKLSEDIIS